MSVPSLLSIFGNSGSGLYKGAILISFVQSPHVLAYEWTSGSGFGTKYANPSPAVHPNQGSAQAKGVKFTPDGANAVLALSLIHI